MILRLRFLSIVDNAKYIDLLQETQYPSAISPIFQP
jgi:hypothetical protein